VIIALGLRPAAVDCGSLDGQANNA